MGPVSSQSIVTPFADRVLAFDLPALPVHRRREVVAFIVRRVDTLPSITRIGVMAIATVFYMVLAVVPGPLPGRVAERLPICSEYLRLVRSLGYAYIWETWPSTAADGGPVDLANAVETHVETHVETTP